MTDDPTSPHEEPDEGLRALLRLFEMLTGSGAGGPATSGSGTGTGGPSREDLEAMLKDAFGSQVQLPPEVTQLLGALGTDPANSPMAAMFRQQFDAFFGQQTPAARLASSTDLARKVAARAGDRVVTAAEQHDAEQAVSVARLWLDPMTTLDSPTGPARAWSAAEWIEASMPRWYAVIEPVADGVAAAGTEALRAQLEELGPAGLGELGPLGQFGLPGILPTSGADPSAGGVGGLAGHLLPMLRHLASGMFAAQIGHAVGALAGDVLSGTEIGLPLLPAGTVALLPAQVAAFGDGLGIEPGEVRLYLAVREAARVRLFGEIPWLAAQLEAAVRDYGRHVSIDTDAIESAVRSVDLSDLAAAQQAFSQAQLFGQRPTPEQQAALARLEATLALVEGWVDLVTERATAAHLPHAEALAEAVRRRRAGGPAQKAFAGLVGLELRPRRLREARTLWAALEAAGGIELRDGSWAYPDLAPTAADLDDPLGYVERRRRPPERDAMDAELDRLLTQADQPADKPADKPADPPADPAGASE